MSTGHRPRLELLPADEVPRIVQEACDVLAGVGVVVEDEGGEALLLEAGATARGGRLCLPETLVQGALVSAPPVVRLYDRDGELAAELGSGASFFDPGSAAIQLLDGPTGRPRSITSGDLVDLARLVDGLQGYALQSTALVPEDVPAELADRHRLHLALLHGRKPVVTGTFALDAFAPMHAMLAAVRGGEEALAERPLAIFDCCPSPPLRWSALTTRVLLDCARTGTPAELVSMPLAGATAPVTLREVVLQHCAENLSGLVLHQLAGPGAPVVYGGAAAAFDMRRGTTPMGAVETMMIQAGCAQVARHLGLPCHGYLGLSDAKVVDYQAGLESGVGAIVAALAGVDLVSGAGMLDFISTQSLEKVLLDHEACTMALRLVRGIETHEADVVGLLGELVLKGEFLSHRHTRAHWRRELGVPSKLIDRAGRADWEAGGSQDAFARARTEVSRRLEAAAAPLDAGRAAEVVGIMEAEARRHGLEGLPGT